MLKRFLTPMVLLAALAFAPVIRLHAQGAAADEEGDSNQNIHLDGWYRPSQSLEADGAKPGPAPKHDLSGVWEPVPKYRGGVFASGPTEMPGDAKHEAIMPYTPEGKAAFLSHHPGFGTTAAPIAEINDPFDICDPIGVPRIDLFNLRGIQIVQTQYQVLILYQNTRIFRTIWTDGRDFPKDMSEHRWFGYSIGKWVDDNTLVVETRGLDDRTWIDNVGRPHSDQLVVEETYHRDDSLTFDLTVKITDPVMYKEPWYALKNFHMGMNSPQFDLREMMCSPSEQMEYNKLLHEAVPESSEKK